jgi:hypothetical protein
MQNRLAVHFHRGNRAVENCEARGQPVVFVPYSIIYQSPIKLIGVENQILDLLIR